MKKIPYALTIVLLPVCIGWAQTVLEPAASFLGYGYMERIGYWVQYAGDVNGDGYDDFMIGNNHSGWNGWDSGAAYLILGRPNIDWGFNYGVENLDAYFVGDELDAAGYGLGGGGDVNGDGYDDMLIGAPAGREQAGPRPGYAFLIFGKPQADWGHQFRLRQNADVQFIGEAAWDVLGIGCAIVGDVNGDGLDDMVIGACDNDYGATDAGKSYLFLGKTGGWDRYIGAGNADASFYSPVYNDASGYTVARAGDINNDGLDDILIGAFKRPGRVYVIFGRAEADWGSNFNLANADIIFYEENDGDMGGFTIDGGDVNGDGINDILIGAPNRRVYLSLAGKIYIFFGRNVWPKSLSLGLSDASYVGEGAGDNLGLTKSLSTGFDLDKDGCDDILLGAMTNDQGGEDAGKAYLVYGRRSGWQNNVIVNQAEAVFVGEDTVSYTGMGINFAGDINGDRATDIILSAPLNTNRRWRSGKAYLFLSGLDFCSIAGRVLFNVTGAPIPGATVTAVRSGNTSVSNSSGEYLLANLIRGTIDISIHKETGSSLDDTDISAYDAALAAQHAVGVITLSGIPREAADADSNLTITMLDAALILRYSVGLNTNPATVLGQWTFTPATRTYDNLIEDITEQNFSAWVRGDVDGNWSNQAGGAYPGAVARPLVSGRDTVSASTGETVTFAVTADEWAGVIAVDIRISYDSSCLELTTVAKTDLTADFTIASNAGEPGVLKVGMMNTEPLESGGEILHVSFLVTGQSGSGGVINLDRLLLNGIEHSGTSTIVEVRDEDRISPEFVLEQNYPNPFNPGTSIPFVLPEETRAVVEIYNILGRRVRLLQEGSFAAGRHVILWDGSADDGRDAGAGVFFCTVRAGRAVQRIKIVKLK